MAQTVLRTFAALAFVGAQAENIQYCGSQPYYPSQYTCYNGFLCPVVSGERYLKCGSACYSPYGYTCDSNGMLQQHPKATHPVELYVKNSLPALNDKPIAACGRSFVIGGSGQACTYCPNPSSGQCAGTTNTTVIYPAGGMDVLVPGGQQTYIEAQGALGFTQAHSTSYPQGAQFGGLQAYDGGYLVYANGRGWLACPQSGGTYKLFAKLDGVGFAPGCVPLNVVTKNVPNGSVGAWQYV